MNGSRSKREYSFEESKAIISHLCEECGIPVPVVTLIDEKTYYYAEYDKFSIFLKPKNTMETIVHEWLHYVFDLIRLVEGVEGDDKGSTSEDNYEHRVIEVIASPLSIWASNLYKQAIAKKRGDK